MNHLLETYPEEIRQILAKYPPKDKQSALMPLLYLAQKETGRLSQEAMADVAAICEVGLSEVVSLAGFYTLFHEEPGGRYRIQVCTDLPCVLRGANMFFHQVSEYLAINEGETTADGLFTLEAVKCLAACHHAPMFQLQGEGEIKYYEDQTIEKFKKVVAAIRKMKKDAGSEEKHD